MWRDLVEGWSAFTSLTWVWVVVLAFGCMNAIQVGAWRTLGPVDRERHDRQGRLGLGARAPRRPAARDDLVHDAVAAALPGARGHDRHLRCRRSRSSCSGYDPEVVPLVLAGLRRRARDARSSSIGWQTAYHEHVPNELCRGSRRTTRSARSSRSRSASSRTVRWRTCSASATSLVVVRRRATSRSALSTLLSRSVRDLGAQPGERGTNPAETTAAADKVADVTDDRPLRTATAPPIADKRPVERDPPRRHLRRRLRVAARQGEPRHGRLPRGRERLHRRRRRRTSPTCARRSSSEIKARTQETDLSVPSRTRRLLVLQPHRTRASSTRSSAAPPADEPTTGLRRRSSPAVDVAGEQILRRLQRARRGPRLLLARRVHGLPRRAPARLLDRHRRATSATRSASRTCAPATCSPTRSPTPLHGVTWSSDGSHLFYATVNDAWRPDKIWRHALGTRRRGRRARPRTRPTGGSGSGVSRTTSDRYLDARPRLEDHVRGARSSRPTTRPASSGSSSRARPASSTTSTTPSSAARTACSSCTTRTP